MAHTHDGTAGNGAQITAAGLASGAVTDTVIGNRTADPTQAPSGSSGTITQLFSWITNRIKAILGTTNWYDAPPTTLTAANTHMSATTGGVHGSTSAPTANALMTRDASGRAQVAVPVAAADIARKDTVDAVATVANAALPATSYTAADVLAKVKTVDGAGSGLDADLFGGQSPSSFWQTSQLRTTSGYLEWYNGSTWQGVGGMKNVQRGVASVSGGSTTDITITAVNMSKSFVTFNNAGEISNVASLTITAQLISSTVLRISSIGAGATNLVWEVVESY